MDQSFFLDVWLSFKNFARRLMRPALFLFILLLVYGFSREELGAEDRFLIALMGLFAFVVILLDVLDKDGPHKTKIVFGAMFVGTSLALAIPIADHAKVGREVSVAAKAEDRLTKITQIEAISSALGDDKFLRLNADGSIEVVDSAAMEREHAIKILNARVAGYREFMYATGRQLSAEAMAQIASTMNINELLGVRSNPGDLAPDESSAPSYDAVEEGAGEADGTDALNPSVEESRQS